MPVPGDTPMIRSDVHFIAEAVAERLRGQHWLPGTIPPEAAEWLRELVRGHNWRADTVVPMGADGLYARWVISPAGAISLELATASGWVFWRGTFEPAAAG